MKKDSKKEKPTPKTKQAEEGGMEKYGVVQNEAEKTAAEKVRRELNQ